MEPKDLIFHKELSEYLYYDKDTGLIFRRKDNKQIFHVRSRDRYQGSFKEKIYRTHRIIWFLLYRYWPIAIDHINGNSLDNRLDNLREVSQKENMKNTAIGKNNISGIKGVSRNTRKQKWTVRMGVDGVFKSFGYFDNLEDAEKKVLYLREKLGYHPNHGREKCNQEETSTT